MPELEEIITSLGEAGAQDEIENPFGIASPAYRDQMAVPDSIPGLRRPTELPYDIKYKVFMVYQPWTSCRRCRAGIEADVPTIVLPDEGTYQCPHVDKDEYVEILNHRAKDSWAIMTHTQTMQQDGRVYVAMLWGVPKTVKKAGPLVPHPAL